jgi:hypothetical protein
VKPGVDPQATLLRVARELDKMQSRTELETALDELEYLFEVLDPEFQDGAATLIDRLRMKLEGLSARS